MATGVSDDGADDVRDLLYNREGPARLLGFYGAEGLQHALGQYGLWDALGALGYVDGHVTIEADIDRSLLFLDASHPQLATRVRLAEFALRRNHLRATPPPGMPPVEPSYEVITVDWLQLVHPLGRFTRERPRLPGQWCPGSGIGERVLELLHQMAIRLQLAGVVTVGEYFHNAWLYARGMPFFDPIHAGRLRALGRVLLDGAGLSLAQASWAVEWGCVSVESEQGPSVYRWRGELQIQARAPSMQSYLSSPTWEAWAVEASMRTKYLFDRVQFEPLWNAHVALEIPRRGPPHDPRRAVAGLRQSEEVDASVDIDT